MGDQEQTLLPGSECVEEQIPAADARALRVLSLGGGTQSCALALMSARGDLPKLDHVGRASPGGSSPTTNKEAPMADDKTRGLYEKYRVERTDGKPVGPCVVLELKDRHARAGILAWADSVEADGYEALAADARRQVAEADGC